MDRGWLATDAIEADERIDFEIGKVEIDVDRVETDEEIDEGILLRLGHVCKERLLDICAGWEGCADEDGESESFGIDVADIDAALMREEDFVAVTVRVDAYVEFCVGRVWKEGL